MGPYKPDWLEKPSGDDMAAFYPARAPRREISGKVTMVCQVKTDGRLSDCRIASETPMGEQFGQAALRLAPKFRMIPPDDLRDNPGEVTIPIVFQIPERSLTPAGGPKDARLLMQGGVVLASVAALLVVTLVWVLARYNTRATKRSGRVL